MYNVGKKHNLITYSGAVLIAIFALIANLIALLKDKQDARR